MQIFSGKKRLLAGFVFITALATLAPLSAFTPAARAADSTSSTLTMPPNNLGLVGWWTFDGPTINGTTVTDVSGQGDNGTMVNSPAPVAGVEGQALSLNGSNQYINCGTNDLAFNFASTSSFTESVWAYPTAVNGQWQAVFSIGRNLGLGNYQGIWLSGGNQWVFGSAGGGNLGTVYATPDKWVNITVVHTASSKAIYINGVLNTTGGGDAIAGDQGGALCGIGSWTQEYFAGSVDDMRVYNRALSPYEIKQIYNAGTATHQNATVNPPNLQSGLAGHWTFDGPTINGTTVADVSGSGNNGTMVNGPTVTPGVEGQALSFNGTSQYVNLGNSLNNTGGSGTISAWAKETSSGTVTQVIAMRGEDTGGGSWSLAITTLSGAWEAQVVTTSGGAVQYNAVQPTRLIPNDWALVTGVFDSPAQTLKLYVNGLLVATTATGSGARTGGPSYIGAYSNGTPSYYFSGSIDDTRIYTRALSATEVQQLYNTGTANHQNATVNPPNLQNGLVGHWTFDGPTISGTTLKDVSGNGNTGTLVGSPTPVAGVLGQALNCKGTGAVYRSPMDLSSLTNATISLWVRPNTTIQSGSAASYLFWINGSGNLATEYTYFGWNTSSSDGRFLTDVKVGSDQNFEGNTSSWLAGKWYNVVVEAGSLGRKIYVDGVLDGSNSSDTSQVNQMTTGENVTSANVFLCGVNFTGGEAPSFNGSIDDVRIYNRALSATEVKQLYNLGR